MAKKIFAIEGEWDEKLSHNESVVAILQLIHDISDVEFIFRKVNTVKSLIKYLTATGEKSMKNYDFILLAFHGDKEDQSIEASSDECISLKKLAKKCKDLFEGKHVHFSSCGIGKDSDGLADFKRITGAKRVTAYKRDVDFFDSSLFDAAIINYEVYVNERSHLDSYMKKIMPKWYDDLGFVIV
jgi:hypothetical protein